MSMEAFLHDDELNTITSCHLDYDEHNGDYDCDYEFGDIPCENCVCNWCTTGGTTDPRTGERFTGELGARNSAACDIQASAVLAINEWKEKIYAKDNSGE
jgi:hypothetical protein